MDFTSPKNMMTTLVQQTGLALITLLRNAYRERSQDEKLEELLAEYELKDLEHADIQDILQMLWKRWDDLKDNLFECHSKNGFGLRFRSYVSLMINARNEWAHNNTFSYEEVLHNCFIVQHFFQGAKIQINTSIVDQIVEACFTETVVEKLSSDDISEVFIAISEKEIEEGTFVDFGAYKVIIDDEMDESENDCNKEEQLVEEQEKEVGEEDRGEEAEEDEQEGDSEETDAEEEESQYDPIVRKQFEVLKMIIEQNAYEKLSNMMGFTNDPEVSEGIYPNTLYITAEGRIWGAFGYEKLKLIKDHLFEVAVFAAYNGIWEHMEGEWEGNTVICLPSNSHSRVMFGRNKARMLCASMEKISKWLENYHENS